MWVCVKFNLDRIHLLIFGIFVLWKIRVFRYSAKSKHFMIYLPTGQSVLLISKWNLNSVINPFSPAAFSAQTRAAMAPPL